MKQVSKVAPSMTSMALFAAICMVTAGAAVTLAGCGDDGDGGGDHDHNGDVSCQGTENPEGDILKGTSFDMELTTFPATVAEGNNDFVFRILDKSGSPVDGAMLLVEPFQAVHGHGTPIETVVTPNGNNGEYALSMVNFLHPGRWELRMDVTKGADTDSFVAAICVAGEPPML